MEILITMMVCMHIFNSQNADPTVLAFRPVSLVDGYDLPVRIDNNVGCGVPGCEVDLGPNCKSENLSPFHFAFCPCNVHLTSMIGPAPLQGPYDSTGFPVGCKSACFANLDGDPSMFFFS